MYSLRVNFRLPPGKKFIVEDFQPEKDGNFEIIKGDYPNRYSLIVSNFSSSKDAENYLDKLEVGLSQFLLKFNFPIDANLSKASVEYGINPKAPALKHLPKEELPVGIAPHDFAYVYKSDERLMNISFSDAELTLSLPCQSLFETLKNSWKSNHNPLSPKLKLALDYYVQYLTGSSKETRLIALMTVLEILSEKVMRSKASSILLEKWNAELSILLVDPSLNEKDRLSYHSLVDEILFKKYVSIRKSIYSLVVNVLEGTKNTTKHANEIDEAYAIRSSLIHAGYAESKKISDALETSSKIVKQILEILFYKQTTQILTHE